MDILQPRGRRWSAFARSWGFISLASPPLVRHLGFDFIDFSNSHRSLVRIGRQTALKVGRSIHIRRALNRFGASHFAQNIKLALTDEVVLFFTHDHRLEGILAITHAWLRVFCRNLVPVLGRLNDKLGYFGKQTE